MKYITNHSGISRTRAILLTKKSVVLLVASILLFQLIAPLSIYAQGTPPADDTDSAAEETFGNLGEDLSYPYYSTNGGGGSCSGVGTGAGGEVPQNFSLGDINDGKTRRVNLIKAFMADYGLTPEQASGPVGNFMHESGGFHLPPDVNEGGTPGPPAFSGGYGWAQWTGGRQDTFIAYAVEKGYMASRNVHATDAANYGYLKKELAEGYQETVPGLKSTSSPEDAAVSFEATFERAGVPALTQRKANARQAFNEYRESEGGGGNGGSGSGSSSCGGNGEATCIENGKYCFPLAISNKSAVSNRSIFANGTTAGGHPTYTAYDILVNEGTQVVAFMQGRVVQVGEDRCPGRYVSIYNQEENVTISYMHMKFENHVAYDTEVMPGQNVGISGDTAQGCTVPHLHIDSIDGDTRLGCSRLGCDYAELFNDIGPKLYDTFQVIPD